MVQRFTAGEHHEGGTGFGGALGFGGQRGEGLLGVHPGRPGVLGVAPAAAHAAAPQPDEQGAAAGVQAFTLEGVEGFHYRQGQARRKRSEYAIRLEEKQKLRFNYGISERQLVR